MSRQRAIHFVDIENLAGTARPDGSQVEAIRRAYEALDVFGPADLVVLACNHGAAPEVRFAWPCGELRQRSGEDGADLALIEAMNLRVVADRFGRIVIASGDRIFAAHAACLAARGLEVVVVTPPPPVRVSRRLIHSVDRVIELPRPGAGTRIPPHCVGRSRRILSRPGNHHRRAAAQARQTRLNADNPR